MIVVVFFIDAMTLFHKYSSTDSNIYFDNTLHACVLLNISWICLEVEAGGIVYFLTVIICKSKIRTPVLPGLPGRDTSVYCN